MQFLADRAFRKLRQLRRRLARQAPARRRIQRAVEETVDWERFEAIRARWAHETAKPDGPVKYFDWRRWLPENVERVIDLGLHRGEPRRVLDLGCGFGYFLLVCEHFGHDTVGLDIPHGPTRAFLDEVIELFELERVRHTIERFTKLPDLGAPFDVVTASQITFDRPNRPDRWDVPEWDFFLRDLRGHCAKDACIQLRFNTPRGGRTFSDSMAAWLSELGARVDGQTVVIDSASRLPE